MRGVRQGLSVWLSVWFLLLNVVALPWCHAPSERSFDGQAAAFCHSGDADPAGRGGHDSGDPAGNADHCPLCLVCRVLSTGAPATAPISLRTALVRIEGPTPPGPTFAPPSPALDRPQQPRAPPSILRELMSIPS
ncbi:DUF2946 family protein [Telmatospirillum siberiense]|uniref:DUF2946 domain-containing protein n=1 Tax=Telmatospirillum siberiense TaxID=382514 RepID=A0A2N3PRY2_9PROT|nr:DUF2946 family protein [Telmatospirillum siberiense]PKU23152.1 hypothetical protein CWS72_18170 [Telmatospirillum siberiense]